MGVLYNRLLYVFRYALLALAAMILFGYLFSVKFLGIVIFSTVTIWVITKMVIGIGIMALILAVLFVLKDRFPVR